MILSNNKCADQTAWMRRLVCAFAVVVFLQTTADEGPYRFTDLPIYAEWSFPL